MPHQITYDLIHELPDISATCIFNHIPKCAGTSLHKNIAQCFSSSQSVLHGNILSPYHFNKAANFYFSHHVDGIEYYSNIDKYYYITFLRHPLNREISNILFNQKTFPLSNNFKGSIEKNIFTSPTKNIFIEYLGRGDKHFARENLFNNYVFFGFVEYFDHSIKLLNNYIDGLCDIEFTVKNVTGSKKDTNIDPIALEYFYDKNRDDIELYEDAVLEFKKRIKRKKIEEDCVENIYHSKKEVNKIENSYIHIADIFEKIISNEHFDSIYNCTYDFEIAMLFYYLSTENNKSIKAFYDWLMARVEIRPSCLSFAFKCAVKLNLPETCTLAKELFNLLDATDPLCAMRTLIQDRLNIIANVDLLEIFKHDKDFYQHLDLWLQKLENIYPWKAKSLYAQALLCEAEEKIYDAILLLEEAASLQQHNEKKLNKLCQLLIKSGQDGIERTQNIVAKALQSNPQCEWALQQSVLLIQLKNNPAERVQALERALEKNPYWEKCLRLYIENMTSNDVEKGTEYAHKLAELSIDSYEVYIFLCQRLFALDKLDDALQIMDEKSDLRPEWASLYMQAAKKLQLEKKFTEALRCAQHATVVDIHSVAPRLFFSKLLLEQGKLTKLEDMAQHYSHGFPLLGWPHMSLALVCEARADFTQAIKHMKVALQKQPDKITFMSEYARLLRINKDWDSLTSFCEQALEKSEAHAWALRELSYAAWTQGDMEKAKKLGEKSLKSYFDEDLKRFVDSIEVECNNKV